jgi:ABC-type uncharacterized transport system involved in gliding motility auxiliary subunit
MNGGGWRRTGFGVGGLIALGVLFLGVVMLANVSLRGIRWDLTQNHLYTLSAGTQQVLGDLKEPVNLYFYFSRDTAAQRAPLLMPYANRVREFLEELAARSHGKIRLSVIDPQPFSEDEDRAAEFGLQPLQTGAPGDSLYFGLAGSNSTDGRGAIPAFQVDREEFLEYDVAKLIHELSMTAKPVMALASSLPMQGQFNPMTGQMGETWPVLAQLEPLFTLRTLNAGFDRIDKDVDVLMIVQPKNLPAQTLYAIDQFVMRGGRVLLFIDPASGADTGNPMSGATPGPPSDLQPLLGAWGVNYDPTQVIGDLALGLEVRTSMEAAPVRHIGILGLHRANMAEKDVVTASLETINLATAGALSPRPGAKTAFEPLLWSSTEAGPIPAERFAMLADPATLRDGFKPTGRRYAFAARITGPAESAFPGGPPAAAPGGPAAPPGPPAAHLARSTAPVNIIIVADTDLLMDYMWVQTRELFGQRVAQAFAANGDLVANALDNLAGSTALISIRGRASFARPFERVEALRRRADDRLRSKALELQTELTQTEAKLTELQAKRNDQSSLAPSPEQEEEIKRFTAEKTEVRRALRETQRGLDVDINRLELWLKIVDIALAPLAVALAGVAVLAWRRRRRSAAAGGA